MYSQEHCQGLKGNFISLSNFPNSGHVYNLSPEKTDKVMLNKAETNPTNTEQKVMTPLQ